MIRWWNRSILTTYCTYCTECYQDDSPVASALKGMCKNATRAISWSSPSKVDLRPLFVKSSSGQLSDGLTITIRVVHITDADNYRIFDYIKSGNISAALDMIDEHKGVNAVDEWGQTTLMTAVQMKSLEMISSLLNTRRPRVNVNMAKSVRECCCCSMTNWLVD